MEVPDALPFSFRCRSVGACRGRRHRVLVGWVQALMEVLDVWLFR